MKNFIPVLCVGSVLALCAENSQAQSASVCDATAGNLVSNCGFEIGDFTDWTLTGNDVTQGTLGSMYGVESGADPVAGTLPYSGSYQAWFQDISADPTTMSQTLATTASSTYTVSFELAQVPEGPGAVAATNSVAVSFGGTTIGTLTAVPTENYTLYTFLGTATSASSVLSLKFGDDIGEFLVDDVTVTQTLTAIPNPANALLLMGGLIAGGWVLKRRGSRAIGPSQLTV